IIGVEPKVDPVSRLVAVRAEVANSGGKLSPGQFVQARVILPEEKNVVALAQTSVVTSLYGDYVFVIRPEEPQAAANSGSAGVVDEANAKASEQAGAEPKLVARQVFVKTGRRSDGLVEILQGVAAGDQVVTAGQNRLSNGAPVAIDNTVNPALPTQPEQAKK